jgi:hypothetical protein
VKVYRIGQADRDIEKLTKRYRTIGTNVNEFERILASGQQQGHDRYSGLGLLRDGQPASIWKAKVIVPQLGGKRSGLRYIYEQIDFQGEMYAIGLMAYVHQSGMSEDQVIATIRERFGKYTDTAALLLSLQL